MKTLTTKEKRAALAVRKTRLYVHHPMGPVQQAQQAAIRQILRPGEVQAKLNIGQPNDKYEQEADRVADQVMAMPDQKLQRQPENEEEEEETLQAKSKPGAPPTITPNLEARIKNLKGGGQPLNPTTRVFFEPRFGYDFSQVRIHSDLNASQSAQEVEAIAYTAKNHVVFREDKYQPNTLAGRRLLAHELTHVIQQSPDNVSNGPVGSRFPITNISPGIQRYIPVYEGTEPSPSPYGFPRTPRTSREVLRDMQQRFRSVPGIDANRDVIERVIRAIGIVADIPLATAFFRYYAVNPIELASPAGLIDIAFGLLSPWTTLEELRQAGRLGQTSRGDTTVDPNILQEGYPIRSLGTVLLHEFFHARHHRDTNWGGADDYLEGEAYGVERFLAQRAGESERVEQIDQIFRTETSRRDEIYATGFRSRYNKSYRTMTVLHLRVDGQPVPDDAPAALRDLTSDQARELVAEFVSSAESDYSDVLRAIVQWVNR